MERERKIHILFLILISLFLFSKLVSSWIETPCCNAYISAHTNNTICVASAGVFYNVTFDQEESTIKKGITHNYNDGTNISFTIQNTAIYEITYTLIVEDSAASPPPNHVIGRVINNGIELEGLTIEEDTTKQNADVGIHHSDLVELTAGDVINLQFTSDVTSVCLTTHLTYGSHKNTGHLTIKKYT